MVRCGIGFDVHAFDANRRLILCGVEIDYPVGLAGHSDADVVSHAIADALLGAAGLGDIGMMFPDTDPANKDISSMVILERIIERLKSRDYKIINIDITIIAQRPKIAPHSETMRKNIAKALAIGPDDINIKGKTTEHLGFAGREEGIAAMAVAAIEKQ
jgi:2-C-methyl-D-erythritol 2,4-cyclodiphosphate synthase